MKPKWVRRNTKRRKKRQLNTNFKKLRASPKTRKG